MLASLSKHLTLSSAATYGLWVIGGIIYLFGGLLAVSSLLGLKSMSLHQSLYIDVVSLPPPLASIHL